MMSSASVKSIRILTPVEKADYHEDVKVGTAKQSQHTFGIKENNSKTNAGENMVVPQGMEREHSNSQITRPEVPQLDEALPRDKASHSDDTRSLENAVNTSSEQDFLSARRSNNVLSVEDDNFQNSDNEIANDNVNNHDNDKHSIEKNNSKKLKRYGETPKENDDTAANCVKKTVNIDKNNDTVTKKNVKDRFVKRVIQATGLPSAGMNRVSTLSNTVSFAKTKLVKSVRPSSVFQDPYSTSSNSLLEDPFSSHEPGVVGLNKVTGHGRIQRLPKTSPETKLTFSFDNEGSKNKHEHIAGSKQISEDGKTADNDGDADALGDPLDIFYTDMIKAADNTHQREEENINFGKANRESKSPEDDPNDETLIGNTISERASSDKITTLISSRNNEVVAIHKHDSANSDLADLSVKQTTSADTFEMGFKEDYRSADSKSISSPAHLPNRTDEPFIKNDIVKGVYQIGSTSDVIKRPADDKTDKESVTNENVIDTCGISGSIEQDNEKPGIGKRQDSIINDVTNNDLVESLGQGVQKKLTESSSPLPDNNNSNIDAIEECVSERKETLLLHSQLQKLNKKQDKRKTNSKNEPVNSSKLAPGTQSKIPVSSKHINYQTIVEMRPIERLLTGPYSESVNQKTPSSKSGTYVNPTKSSSTKTQIQKIRNKVKFNKEDKEILKTQSAKTSSANSVRVSNRQVSSAKSDEIKPTTRTHIKKFTESKPAAHKDQKSMVRAPKRKLDHPKAEPDISSTEQFIPIEELDPALDVTYLEDQQDATMAIPDSRETQDTATATDEADVYVDVADTAQPETAQQENDVAGVDNTVTEMSESEIVLENRQVEGSPSEIANENIIADKQKESDSKGEKKDKQAAKEKPTTLTEWFKAKKRSKKLSPKLVKKQSKKYQTELKKNEARKSVGIKNVFLMAIKDKQETLEPAKEKPDKASPKYSPDIPPASIVIVDETSATEGKPNSHAGQVIQNGFLQTFKSKSMPEKNISTTTSPTTLTLGLPLPDSILANGVGKLHERATTKSVSIHSLTVPGLLPNPFSGDSLIDEDSISIYSRRDSTRQSFDSGSRKSVDYRIRNTTQVVLPAVEEKPKSIFTNDESFIKNAIPFLPINLAVLCLVLNIIIPGSGTALSGLSILCCGQPRLSNKDDQIWVTFCANFMVGLAQLFTVTFLLVGWFWSIGWGIQMVMLSVQHEKEMKEQRAKELQSLALSALGSPKRSTMFDT